MPKVTDFSRANVEQLRADDHVGEDAATRLMGLSKFTLRNYRHLHKGPPYVRIGRAIRYRVGDILDFLDSRKITPDKAA